MNPITHDAPMVGYKLAIYRLDRYIGSLFKDVFEASLMLAVIYDKPKEETLNDILSYRQRVYARGTKDERMLTGPKDNGIGSTF